MKEIGFRSCVVEDRTGRSSAFWITGRAKPLICPCSCWMAAPQARSGQRGLRAVERTGAAGTRAVRIDVE